MVEKVDGRRIDQFCQEEIFAPLEMSDTSFEINASQAPRLSSVNIRGEDGKFGDFALAPPSNPEFYGMGHALYSTAPNYMRFLRMVMNGGALDGKRLISEAGLLTMLAKQIGNIAIPVLTSGAPPLSADVDFFSGQAQIAQHGLHAL